MCTQQVNENEARLSKIELRKSDVRQKLIVPKKVEEKIRIACSSIPNREWSGVLFYTYKGSFDDGSLVVTCKDILIMDVGTATYTEWNANAEVIKYMSENGLLDCQMAILHSHNNMSAFFSGTDLATLLTEGQDRNNLVSLIVNNAGVYEAAITRCVHSTANITEHKTYEFFGEGSMSCDCERVAEETYVEYFMMDIERKCSSWITEFTDRLKGLINKPVNVPVALPTSTDNHWSHGSYGYWDRSGNVNAMFTTTGNLTDKQMDSLDIDKPRDVVDSGFIDNLVAQLVTGDVFVPKSFNVQNYVRYSMASKFRVRFGESTGNNSDFGSFIDALIDFLVYNSDDESLADYSINERSDVIVREMHERLIKLTPKNKYLDAIITKIKELAL